MPPPIAVLIRHAVQDLVGDLAIFRQRTVGLQNVGFHAELSRFFHREVSHL